MFALRVVAQPQPLVVTTVAGMANFGDADGIGSAAKFLLPTGVAVDTAGNVYVADTLNDTIRKVTPTGVVTTLAGSAQMIGTNDATGSAARFSQPYGVTVDSFGNVYVADYYNSAVRKITTNGAVTTITASPPFYAPYGVAVDGSNNVYVADTYHNMIRKIANGSVTTLAGSGGPGSADGTNNGATFNKPYALAVDSAGNVYVADWGNNLIRLITPAGVVTTIAGRSGPTFSAPSGIAVDTASNVYVADTTNQLIRKITRSGTNWVVSTLVGGGFNGNESGDGDGIDPNATFYYPWGLAVDSAGNVYVGDSFNGNIRKITPGGSVSTLAGPDASYGLVDDTMAQARFNEPTGVAVDGATNLYVADYYNNCIREVTSAGSVATIAGSINGDPGSTDGTNNNAEFNNPNALCIDGASNIYVADTYNSTVRKISPTNGGSWVTTTLAGQARNIGYRDNVIGTNALFAYPYAIAVDSGTNLYVIDYNNQPLIRKITPNGVVSTYAGTHAEFSSPRGIAVDNFTNVYVTDAGNNVVYQVATNGAVSTFSSGGGLFNVPEGIAVDSFGNVYVGNSGANTILGINSGGKSMSTIAGTSGFIGSADGLSSAAQFDDPIGVAVDSSGNIYVADELNNTIRKGAPYIAQTVVLMLDTSPSGLPVSVNGTNYPYTPQILSFAAGSTNTATIMVTNIDVFTNTAGITVANYYVFTNWALNGSAIGTSSNCNFILGTNVNQTLVANLTPRYTLAVNASPTNDGAVTGGGIFLPGSTNTVTATASNGYALASWVLNGTVVSTSSNYTFVLGDNDVLVANFLPAYTISVSASPTNGGTVGGGGTFVQGITNTVTATASNGFIFTNWTVSNIVVSAASNYTFTLSSNVALVANFLPTYMLAASTSPLNGGNVIGGGTFVQGTTNTVTATATNGFIFADWTVSNIVVSTSPGYNVVLTNNEAIVANFLPLYTITVSATPNNGGTVSGNGTFVSGSTNTVTATVTNGFIFTDWTVSNIVVSTLANYSFALNNNVTLVAHFLPLYTLAVNAAPVSGGMASGGGIYAAGSTNTVTATPTNGFIFTNWTVSNVVVSTSSNYNVLLTNNETIVANFLPLYAITVNASPVNGGTVGGGGTFVQGSTNTVTAIASNNFVFTDWTVSNNVVSTSSNYSFALSSNVMLVANFLPSYTLTVSNFPANGGNVSGGGTFVQDKTNTVIATANPGYVLTNWTQGLSVASTSSNYTFVLNSNVSLVANFVTTPPQIEIFNGTNVITNSQSASVGFGNVQQNQAGPTVVFTVTNLGGQTLDLTGIEVPSGFTLISNFPATIAPLSNGTFSVQIDTTAVGTNSGNINITNNDPSNNPFSFPVSGVITSIPTDIVSLSALPLNGGTVSIGGTNGGGAFPVGSTQTVTATGNPGFKFLSWSGDASGISNPLTVIVNTNLNITANFAVIGTNITVTVTTNGVGTVTPNLNGKNLKAGRSYTLIATAKTGNVFSNWTGSITTNKNPLTVKVESSMVLQANFIPNPFLPLKGTYNGLFATTNGVTEQTAGMLKRLIVNQTGTYSGTLLINGGSHGLSGTFNLDGQATKGISRPASQGGNLVVEMALVTASNSSPQVTGTVSGTGWVANLTADRATNIVPSAQYTMLIPPDTNNAPPTDSPGGDGYALITNHLGTATITGALADGTLLSQTASVSQDGYVPIYANLYGSKGVLLGWINLLTNSDGVSLTWIHPIRPTGLYMNGFTNVLLTNQILLSPWVNSSGTVALLTNLSILDTINGSNTPISVTITSGKVMGPSVSGTVNPKTGLLTVTIGSGATRVTGHGAILLNGTNGGGYFLTKTNGQAIKLEP